MRESHGEAAASHTGPSRAPVPARAGAKRGPMGICLRVGRQRQTCRPGIEPRRQSRRRMGVGRLTSETDAIGKSEYYAYDAVGNPVRRTDGDGRTTYYAYDAVNRLSQVAYPEGYSSTFTYDAVGNLWNVWDPYTSDGFTFDPANRLIARWIGGVGVAYFQYDVAGRRTKLVDPKGGMA